MPYRNGFPSNPVTIINRLMPNDVLPSFLPPKLGEYKPSPIPGTPSRNLAGIFHNIQDIIYLHGSVLGSNPIPYRLLKTNTASVEKLNDVPVLRGPIARVSNIIKGRANVQTEGTEGHNFIGFFGRATKGHRWPPE